MLDPMLLSLIAERGKTHGDTATQFNYAQRLKNIYRQAPGWSSMTDLQREALDMVAVKTSRILVGDANHKDHWVDLAGYATLVANSLK